MSELDIFTGEGELIPCFPERESDPIQHGILEEFQELQLRVGDILKSCSGTRRLILDVLMDAKGNPAFLRTEIISDPNKSQTDTVRYAVRSVVCGARKYAFTVEKPRVHWADIAEAHGL